MDVLLALPADVFLDIFSYLSPREVLRCRRVNRQWRAILTSNEVAWVVLKKFFPRCREVRLVEGAHLLASQPWRGRDIPHNLRVELQTLSLRKMRSVPGYCDALFTAVAKRYHNLLKAKTGQIMKLEMAPEISWAGPFPDILCFTPVPGWDRYLSYNEAVCSFHYPDPMWWYSREDGLLVFPSKIDFGATAEPGNDHLGFVYKLYDPELDQHVTVPFDVRRKIVRRVRLSHGVLIFEWAEAGDHWDNGGRAMHHHYATAFDVARIITLMGMDGPQWKWLVKCRATWKIHPLGFGTDDADRFFSAHNGTHYALYYHKQSDIRDRVYHSFVEGLTVWDISTRSQPLSSSVGTAQGNLSNQVGAAPTVTLNLNSELAFYGLRQHQEPKLRHLALDNHNVYFIEEGHTWARGSHAGIPPRFHEVRSTAIPIVPYGPDTPVQGETIDGYAAEEGAMGDAEDGANHDTDNGTEDVLESTHNGPPPRVEGPMWMDVCGGVGDRLINFCRHIHAEDDRTELLGDMLWGFLHDRGPHNPDQHFEQRDNPPPPAPAIVPATNIGPAGNAAIPANAANPTFARRTQALETTYPWGWRNRRLPQALFPWSDRDDTTSTATQPGRWPGYAPCWRHVEFPYLATSEMIDFAAGVRVSARHCFMLQHLSVHTRPALWVKGPTPGDDGTAKHATSDERSDDVDDYNYRYGGGGYTDTYPYRCHPGDDDEELLEMIEEYGDPDLRWVDTQAPRLEEAMFPEPLYRELLGRGTIAGDERWVVGQDGRGSITLVRF